MDGSASASEVARRPEADQTFPPRGRLVVLSGEQVREYAGARCAAHFVLGGPCRGLAIRQWIETNIGQASTPAHDGGMHRAQIFIGGDQQNELETLADVAGFGSPEWRGLYALIIRAVTATKSLPSGKPR